MDEEGGEVLCAVTAQREFFVVRSQESPLSEGTVYSTVNSIWDTQKESQFIYLFTVNLQQRISYHPNH